MSPASLARRERRALCDLALSLGEDAPTLCGEWSAKQLVEHLLVRENRPLAAVGLVVPRLSGLTERAMERMGRQDFTVLVERLRRPRFTPHALPPVDVLFNTVEYFVHHEDLRRARPGWEPRRLDPADEALLWRLTRTAGKGLVRSADVPVVIRRSDGDGGGNGGGSGNGGGVTVLRAGADPVVVTGRPSEILLMLFGRSQVRGLTFDGPADRVRCLRKADLGI